MDRHRSGRPLAPGRRRGPGGGVSFPSHSQLDSGAPGPLLLPRPLRLPQHAGGVRAGARLGSRPGYHAGQSGRAVDRDAFGEPPGLLPARRGDGLPDWRSDLPAAHRDGRQPTAGRRHSPGSGPEFSQLEAAGAVPIFRAHTPPDRRHLHFLAVFRAAHHRGPGPHVLCAVYRARPHHCLPGHQPHHRRRLPRQRRHGIAGHPGRLRGNRHRKRRAVPLAAAQGG